MKLIFIITGLNTGGAEMMLLKVLERLDSRFSAHVISLTSLSDIGPRIQSLGVPVEALGMNRDKFPNPVNLFRLVRRLRALRPDIVHTWMYHADLFGGLAARLAGVSCICWSIRHCNLSPEVNKHWTLLTVKVCTMLSYWLPLKILCCSEVSRKMHVDYGYNDRKMTVIPNGFDLLNFRPDDSARRDVRREIGLDENSPLVGLIGRFNPHKNHLGFVQAAGLLRRKMPGVHFLLAGSGVDEFNTELMQMIDTARIKEMTHLMGQRTDISRLMAALDILVSTSIGEAFPNVIGEAMACGVPCVVTDVGDSAIIVGDTGRVVMPDDMWGLAEAVAEILELPAVERRAMGASARARVAEHFEIGQVVKRYEMLYEELVGIERMKIEAT